MAESFGVSAAEPSRARLRQPLVLPVLVRARIEP